MKDELDLKWVLTKNNLKGSKTFCGFVICECLTMQRVLYNENWAAVVMQAAFCPRSRVRFPFQKCHSILSGRWAFFYKTLKKG